MQPDPMNPDLTPEQRAAIQWEKDRASEAAVAERALAERATDLRIERALEKAPQIHIPADFAAKVAARIPAQSVRLRTARIRARSIGFGVAAACLILLAVAMLALAPHTTHNTVYIALQWTLAAQFCLIAAWIAKPRRT